MTEENNEEFQSLSIADENVAQELRTLSDEALTQLSIPVFNSSTSTKPQYDADGFPTLEEGNLLNLHQAQKVCRQKAEENPQINSHVRDVMGRMAGWGFEFTSALPDLQRAIDDIMEDPRNDLYQNFPKFIARTETEGELFLMFTMHEDGFIEVDFISPSSVGGAGDDNSGILFHPTKQNFPLFYNVQFTSKKNDELKETEEALIPSVNIAYFPNLEEEAKKHSDYDSKKTKFAKASNRNKNKTPYGKFNGYYRFIVHWNKGFMTRRNVSHIKTTIEWVNYYESLKKYEIDHKKSSGAYLWVITMEDPQAFRRWLQMDEAQRKATGIMQPKDPGGTLVLPPGMSLQVQNPKLSAISDQDNDIMQMVSSGLQKPQDTMLGDYRSSYASVKASQGPQGDRINDELHYFKMFLLYSFWRPILYLRSAAKSDFSYKREIEEVTRFEEGEPVKEKVMRPAYKFIDVCLPVSRLEDIEATARAMLGTKHGSVGDVLGIPNSEIAKRLGFNNYPTLRKQRAMEDEIYPETLSGVDQESEQEQREAEPPGKKTSEQK